VSYYCAPFQPEKIALTDPRKLLEDGLAGAYTIGRAIGRGGMATVYLSNISMLGVHPSEPTSSATCLGSGIRDRNMAAVVESEVPRKRRKALFAVRYGTPPAQF